MHRTTLITFILLLSSIVAICQRQGDSWVIGYFGGKGNDHSLVFLDFTKNVMHISLKLDIKSEMLETGANICNSAGEPIIWTNGMEIFGPDGAYIADTIAFDGNFGYWSFYSGGEKPALGFRKTDGALIIPVPDSENEYSVIYHTAQWHPDDGYYQIWKFLEARVEMSKDSVFSIAYQDSLIGEQHHWYVDRIEAVRHANGRDWWIVFFERLSSKYYCFILTPEGIQHSHIEETKTPVIHGLGQSCFSPDGSFFARMDGYDFVLGNFLTLYSFDRCAGHLEILETFNFTAGILTGVAFSPSGQYLYGNNNDTLWQWDLWSVNIPESKKIAGEFDGFVEPGWFPTRFGPQVLAPDGKIYMMPVSSTKYMHVINRPDLPADMCKFDQHSINLTVPNARTAPNIPNFRLGPLDGSPCDTLGIDNIPVSRWRYEEDQPGWRYDIRFTDLSFYDPKDWHWDFGDGQSSDEISPVHTYASSGIYEVCLTVSNENGSDTKCQEVEILTTALQEALDKTPDLSITPNPFVDQVQIKSRSGTFRAASLEVFDMHGTKVFHQASIPVPVTLKMPQLPSGMYLFRIRDQDGTLYSFKAMKI